MPKKWVAMGTVHCDNNLTPAKKRYIEQREQIDVHRLAKVANKSHSDRIQDFNQYRQTWVSIMTFLKLVQDDSGKFMSMKKDQPFMSVVCIQCGSCQRYFLFGHIVLYGRWFSVWWFISILELDYKLLSMKFAFARKTRIYSHLSMLISARLSSVPALGFPLVPSTS